MNILTVIGARPQFIKASAVSAAFAAAGSSVNEIVVHTGQHYDAAMSDIFFAELEMPQPSYNLSVGSGPHGQQTGRMLEAIEAVLLDRRPDCILVYGDTNSTVAGALAASKLGIPIAHVESGLRSFNRKMPEEINRIVTDHLADILFTPTITACHHLRNEGIPSERVHFTGDVMLDVARRAGQRASTRSAILQNIGVEVGRFVLSTVHRAENTDDSQRLTSIMRALNRLATDIPVVFPMHPRTRSRLETCGQSLSAKPGLHIVNPLGYLDMAMLEQSAALIATDSGGVQKEAFFYRVPCVTLRDETEWTELVDLGWNRLAPPKNDDALYQALLCAIGSKGEEGSPYGNGCAAEEIVRLTLAAPWKRHSGSL